jgi:hypothetical protein
MSYLILTGERTSDLPEVAKCYFAYIGKPYECSETLSNKEINCLIHGVYHHLSFAYWCKDNIDDLRIKEAVSAKLIMNDDLSFVVGKPYCIWYPETAKEDIYRKLYKIHPEHALLLVI